MKINFQKSSPLKREAHNFCFQKTFWKQQKHVSEFIFYFLFFKMETFFSKKAGSLSSPFFEESKNRNPKYRVSRAANSPVLLAVASPANPAPRSTFLRRLLLRSRHPLTPSLRRRSDAVFRNHWKPRPPLPRGAPFSAAFRARHTTHVCQQPRRDLCLRLRRWSSAARPQFREELHWKGWFRKRLFCEAKFTWVQALYIRGFEESIYGGDRGLVWRGFSRTVHICWNCKSGTVKLYSYDTEVFAISHVSDSYLSLRLCIYDVNDYF